MYVYDIYTYMYIYKNVMYSVCILLHVLDATEGPSWREQTVADNVAALSDWPLTYFFTFFFFFFILLSPSRPPPIPSPPLPRLTADFQRGPFAGRFRGRSQVLQSAAAQALPSGGERPQAHGAGLQHQGEGSHALALPKLLLSLCFVEWWKNVLAGVRSSASIGKFLCWCFTLRKQFLWAAYLGRPWCEQHGGCWY